VAKKLAHFVLYPLTSSNIDRFSNLFHSQNQENMCNNSFTKDPTTPKVCRYTTFGKCQYLKSNSWEQDDFCNNIFKSASNGRSAARRTHLTFEVNTLQDATVTLDNNWDNKHVVSCY